MLFNANSRYDVMSMGTNVAIFRGIIMIPFSNIMHISSKIPSFYGVADIILLESIFYLVILCARNEGTLKIHELISNTFIRLHYTRINA